jgi:hypothetical protein
MWQIGKGEVQMAGIREILIDNNFINSNSFWYLVDSVKKSDSFASIASWRKSTKRETIPSNRSGDLEPFSQQIHAIAYQSNVFSMIQTFERDGLVISNSLSSHAKVSYLVTSLADLSSVQHFAGRNA